jgi:hypothetical protein
MSLRIIQIALSGGHRKVQAKGIRYVHGNDLFQPWFFYFSLRRFHPARQPTHRVGFQGIYWKAQFLGAMTGGALESAFLITPFSG